MKHILIDFWRKKWTGITSLSLKSSINVQLYLNIFKQKSFKYILLPSYSSLSITHLLVCVCVCLSYWDHPSTPPGCVSHLTRLSLWAPDTPNTPDRSRWANHPWSHSHKQPPLRLTRGPFRSQTVRILVTVEVNMELLSNLLARVL